MKKLYLGILVGTCLTFILSFTVSRYEPNHSTAEVQKIDGFYVFTDSRPVMPYDSLGLVDLGFVSGTKYENIRTNLFRRARKKYPNADGIIMNLKRRGVDNGQVIKFK